MWEMEESSHEREEIPMTDSMAYQKSLAIQRDKEEKEMVPDTIFTLRKTLESILQCEYTEGCIYKELQDIKRQFNFDEGKGDEGFYGEMLSDSNERAKKLFLFRKRVEELLSRLTLFLKIKSSEIDIYD